MNCLKSRRRKEGPCQAPVPPWRRYQVPAFPSSSSQRPQPYDHSKLLNHPNPRLRHLLLRICGYDVHLSRGVGHPTYAEKAKVRFPPSVPNLVTWSDSASLNFNYSKCKAQCITRKLKPVIFVYHMAGSQLEVVCAEKDLGVYITDNLTWNKQVNVQCAMASRLLGYVRRNTKLVKSITVRRSAYLTLVRPHLGYATQVWTPQSIDLIRKLERVQRRATKYILHLPFICDQRYGERLLNLNLLPISYWHEFLDMIFFFKIVTGTFRVSPSVLPQVLVTRTTRSNSNHNVTHFISRKCNTVTFRRSFSIEPPESGTC